MVNDAHGLEGTATQAHLTKPESSINAAGFVDEFLDVLLADNLGMPPPAMAIVPEQGVATDNPNGQPSPSSHGQ